MAFKLSMVASSDEGDKIYCLYKNGSDILVRGYYDFNKDTFIVTSFHSSKLKDDMTVESVIEGLKTMLLLEHDWEFKYHKKVIKLIKEGIIKARKRKNRKKKNGDKETYANETYGKGTGSDEEVPEEIQTLPDY